MQLVYQINRKDLIKSFLAVLIVIVLCCYSQTMSTFFGGFGYIVYTYYIALIIFGVSIYIYQILFECKNSIYVWFFLILILLISCLFGVWESGYSSPIVIGGVIPYSDAASYFMSAEYIRNGGELNVFTSRRPLFTMLLSSLLTINNGSYFITLITLSVIAAIAISLYINFIQNELGQNYAIIAFILIIGFYRRYVGVPLTEHLGLILGTCGFIVCWNSVKHHKPFMFYLGSAVISTALISRAGALLVLPFIVLSSGLVFTDSKLFRIRPMLYTLLSVFIPFIVNSVIVNTVGILEASFSNWSYTLYGILAHGNWTTIYKDHPEIIQLPGVEKSQYIFQLCVDIIKKDPSALLIGVIRSIKDAFFGLTGSWGSFVLHRTTVFNEVALDYHGMKFVELVESLFRYKPIVVLDIVFLSVTVIVFNVLFAIFPFLNIVLLRKTYNRELMFLTLFCMGIISSVMFVPPCDADNMRVFSATLPVHIFIVLIVVQQLTQRRNVSNTNNDKQSLDTTPLISLMLSLSIILLLLSQYAYVLLKHGNTMNSKVNIEPVYNNKSLHHILTKSVCFCFTDNYSSEERIDMNTVDYKSFRYHLKNLRYSSIQLTDDLETLGPMDVFCLLYGHDRSIYYQFANSIELDSNIELSSKKGNIYRLKEVQ